MRFRGDIEGLRGVAVALVVLAHAGVPGFAGGFIGVDVFFVISGFLITGLLWAERHDSGRLDLWNFYARRARRLAPAVLSVLVIVSLVAWATLPRGMLPLQAESGAWAALWFSNVFFAVAGFEYFDAGAKGSLWLHTWSLGVEEQFYLVWPWVMLAAWRSPRRTAWLAGVAVASFVACLWAMRLNAQFAYYAMPTRLWQLALGGLVFAWLQRPTGLGSGAASAIGAVGVLLLAAGVVMIDGTVPYPGVLALLPAFGAAALILAGSTGRNPVTHALESPVVGLPGRISYSWYLWHWPLLMIWPLIGVPESPQLRFGAVLLSFLLAWGSWKWIEHPFRQRRGSPRRTVVTAVVASVAVAAALIAAGRSASTGAEQDLGSEIVAMVSTPALYADVRCDQWYESSEVVPCFRPDTGPGPATIVLIGDSVGAQWTPAAEALARERGERLVVLTKSACPIADIEFVYERIHRRYTECEEWREGAMSWLEAHPPALVLVGSSSNYPFNPSQWHDGSTRTLARLADIAPVVLLAPTPVLPVHGMLCSVFNARREHGIIVVDGCEAPLADTEPRDVISTLSLVAMDLSRVRLVSMNDAICDDGRCRAFRDGRLVFRDSQHLNATAVEALAPEFIGRVQDAASGGD